MKNNLVWGMISRPRETINKIKDMEYSELRISIYVILILQMIVVAFLSNTEDTSYVALLIISILLAIPLGLLSTYISSKILNFIVTKVGKVESQSDKLYKVTFFTLIPMALLAPLAMCIPIANSTYTDILLGLNYGVSVWIYILLVLGVQNIYNLSLGKSIVMLLLLFIVYILITLVITSVLATFFLGALFLSQP